MKLLIKWLICVAAMLLMAQLFPNSFIVTGGALAPVAAGTVLWLLNLFIRPILQLLSLPISILTFGLFSLVVNAAVVALADAILPVLTIESFWLCALLALIITAGNTLLLSRTKKRN